MIEDKQQRIGIVRSLIKKSTVRYNTEVKKPPICIDIIEGVKFIRMATYGNISIIMAEQKGKKTHLLILFIVACLKGTIFNFCGRNEGRKVVVFDTEQSQNDIEWVIYKIVKLCGFTEHPKDLEVISLNAYDAQEQLEIIEQYITDNKNIGFVAIDGLLDLVDDFNDIRESKDCYIRIKKLIKENQFHLCGILHTGTFNERNALGHIGRVFQRKAETVIELQKNEPDEKVLVYPRFIRGTQKFKPFYLGIDEGGLPYIEQNNNDNLPF